MLSQFCTYWDRARSSIKIVFCSFEALISQMVEILTLLSLMIVENFVALFKYSKCGQSSTKIGKIWNLHSLSWMLWDGQKNISCCCPFKQVKYRKCLQVIHHANLTFHTQLMQCMTNIIHEINSQVISTISTGSKRWPNQKIWLNKGWN
jgi:hypothetical protein